MFLPRLAPSKLLVPSLVVATVLASVHLTQAKSIRSLGYSNLRASDANKMRRGGCAAFGHSCFGGHGKRSDSTASAVEGDADAPSGLQAPADDARIFAMGEGSRAPIDNFSRDQADSDMGLIMSPQYQPDDYVRFSPLFRKWLANSYRRGDLLSVNN